LFILEAVNSVVRKVDAAGIISTVAGNGTKGYSGDGGPATLAQLNNPFDLAIDPAGNIYIAEKYNKVIRKVNTAGIITTFAGNGTSGYSGDGGPATVAQFTSPDGVAVDNTGNVFIADGQNAVIRKVNSAGIISTIAGKGTYGYSGDGGQATSAQFAVNSPNDITIDNAGNIYAADYENHVIRKIDTSGIISTVAGMGKQAGYSGDGGPATSAKLWFPTAISVDSCNNLYITDSYNNRIRKVSSPLAATVNVQPVNATICNNTSTRFNIQASNTTSYQWMVNAGSGWVNVSNDGTYTGANTNTLQISRATSSMNSYEYRCLVSNACGPNYSAIATLSVTSSVPPTVTISASSSNICIGNTVSFSATTANAGTNSTYQWKKNSLNVGTNSATYVDNLINNGDIITCSLTSGNSCLNSITATSNAIVITVNPLVSPSITISSSSNNICTGTVITFTAAISNAGNNPGYQWKKNGSVIGSNSSTYTSNTLLNGDVITCTLTANGTCIQPLSITSNSITITINQDITPEVTVAATADTICAGTSVTFTATNKSGNPNPIYQWIVDGKNVGTNSTIYTTSALTNGSVVECMMTVAQCVGTTKDYSDPIKITVNPILDPSITISSSSTDICKGADVAFNASVSQAGTTPNYQWKINGNNAGQNSKSFTTSNLNNGDIVTCILTVDPFIKCFKNINASSNAITVNVTTPVKATVNITASANDICSTKPITFTASTQNIGGSPTYTWQLNSNKVGTNNPTYTHNSPMNSDKIKLIVTSVIQGCSTISTDTSNIITLSIKQTPGITLSPADTVVTIGTQVQLRATLAGNIASYSWSPVNTLTSSQTLSPLTLPIQTATIYKLDVVSAEGCRASKEATIKVITDLYMPNTFTPNEDGKNDVFRIPPAVSLKLKEFTVYNRWGIKVFTTTDVQKGWNGKYKGKLSDMGVYVYFVRGSNYQGKDVFLKGTVLLLR